MLLNLDALRLSKVVIRYQWRISKEDTTFFAKDDKFSSEVAVFTYFLDCKTGKIKFL